MLILWAVWTCFEHIQTALTCIHIPLLLLKNIASIQLTSLVLELSCKRLKSLNSIEKFF